MNKWYMYNPPSVLQNGTHRLLWDFEIQTDPLISARQPDLIIIIKSAVPAHHRVKLKGTVKKDKYLDLARELEKPWNMNVTVIPTVVGTLGTGIKDLVKGLEDLEIRGRVETIQTTALLRSA